jgi:DNA-binding MarR family transcriptional regulator
MRTHSLQAQFMISQNMSGTGIMRPVMAQPSTADPAARAGSEDALVDSWRGLLARHARAHAALERALKAHELGVSEYEVLERLAGGPSPEERRMHDLGKALHLSQSALSRAVGRLEQDGLAVRGICATDRRGIMVCITDAGRERYEQARPAHRAALAEALGDA